MVDRPRSHGESPTTGATPVVLWLQVRRSSILRPSVEHDAVWSRTALLRFLPAPGDRIALWPDVDGNVFGGVTWPVRDRTWAVDGSVSIELLPMRVDPDDETMRILERSKTGLETVLLTTGRDASGNPDDMLPLGGWTR